MFVKLNDECEVRGAYFQSTITWQSPDNYKDDAVKNIEALIEVLIEILTPGFDEDQKDGIMETMDMEALLNDPDKEEFENKIVVDDIEFQLYAYDEYPTPTFKIKFKEDCKCYCHFNK